MSGICGLFNINNAPVADAELRVMTSLLEQRGPDATGLWREGQVGVGHTLLATTPESLFENQPFRHSESGCVITADVRLDNRNELLAALKLSARSDSIGDAELVLHSYLKWSEECLKQLLGDFAFAIFDPRHQKLFCARDRFGMRPLYYHHAPGQRFVFASDARAILVLPQVPYQVNAGRVADFLVQHLEWIDYTSTFYEEVFRLPPGHQATVTPAGLSVTEYWKPEPGPELGLMSDDDYAQGFLEVFTAAVESRLRARQGAVGSMLSGGIDSGSVVAIAKDILNARGDEALKTFSAVRRRDTDCAESRAIYAAAAMPSISPTLILPDSLEDAMPKLASGFEEPFDGEFMILKAVYLAAQEKGQRVLFDGGGGDAVLSEGSYVVRLIREGQFKLAMAEVTGENRNWSEVSLARDLFRYARAAIVPEPLKKILRPLRVRSSIKRLLNESLISRDFAESIDIEDRCAQYELMFPSDWTSDYAVERSNAIRPNVTGGRERYARIAASTASEACDPFLDKRVVDYCSRLPGRSRMKNGWYKMILRDVMVGRLPDEVRWARGKPHLGWVFNETVSRHAAIRGDLELERLQKDLDDYVDRNALTKAWQLFQSDIDAAPVHSAYVLSTWLREAANRPVVTA